MSVDQEAQQFCFAGTNEAKDYKGITRFQPLEARDFFSIFLTGAFPEAVSTLSPNLLERDIPGYVMEAMLLLKQKGKAPLGGYDRKPIGCNFDDSVSYSVSLALIARRVLASEVRQKRLDLLPVPFHLQSYAADVIDWLSYAVREGMK